ncbi:hypothetical protein D3C75_1195450 [compost metagenome]
MASPATTKLATCRLLSTSLSLLRTLPVAALSSSTLLLSAASTLASSTGSTVMSRVVLEPVLVV